MNTLLYLLGNVRKSVIDRCSRKTRTQYLNLGRSLILTVFLSGFGGWDIASQFTNIQAICVGVGFAWAVVTLSFDYFLISSSATSGFYKALRIVVGLCNISITISALFVLLNQASIDSDIKSKVTNEINALDSVYARGKEARYRETARQKTEADTYYHEEVETEARRGGPGPKFDRKKAVHTGMIEGYTSAVARLDSAEKQYFKAYQTERQSLESKKFNDFFAKVRVLPETMLAGGWLSLALAACLFIFLSYIELQAIAQKLNMKAAQEEYDREEAIVEKQEREVKAEEEVVKTAMENKRRWLDTRIQEQQIKREEYDLEMIELEDAIVREAEIEGRLAILKQKGYKRSKKVAEKIRKKFINDEQETTSEVKNDPQNTTEVDTVGDPFSLTKPMKAVFQNIRDKSTSDRDFAQSVFDWICTNIAYHHGHGKFFYRTAVQTFNDGRGLCGEQALLFLAFLKAGNITADFVEVTTDLDGKEVNHACVLVKYADGESHLADTSYHVFVANHQHWEVWPTEKLIVQLSSWNL